MAQMYFYYSAMNAGKSTTLLQSSFNYQERGMNPLIYTAALDDRYGMGKVSSRIGLQSEAQLFNEKTDLYAEISNHNAEEKRHCILIDECQFLSRDQVYQLTEVVDKLGIRFYVMACEPIFLVSFSKEAAIYFHGQINW